MYVELRTNQVLYIPGLRPTNTTQKVLRLMRREALASECDKE